MISVLIMLYKIYLPLFTDLLNFKIDKVNVQKPSHKNIFLYAHPNVYIKILSIIILDKYSPIGLLHPWRKSYPSNI